MPIPGLRFVGSVLIRLKGNKDNIRPSTGREKTKNTCKSSGGCRDAKITRLGNDHVFNFGAELIIVFIRSEAIIDENLKQLRIYPDVIIAGKLHIFISI